jgi:hypothetical protein
MENYKIQKGCKVVKSFFKFTSGSKAWCMVPIASVMLVGCASTKSHRHEKKHKHRAAVVAPVVPKVQTIEGVGVGFIEPEVDMNEMDQKEALVKAEGIGFPSATAKTNFQKRITALEAAKYRALVALLEKENGVNVSKDVKVVDLVFSGENIHVSTKGTLSGVSVVSEAYDASTEVATVEMGLLQEKEVDPIVAELKKDCKDLKRQKAIVAAKAQAIGNLKAKLGKTYAQQKITVKNMELSNQVSKTYIEGALKDVQFSQPRWLNSTMCEITARVEVTLAK